jgi:hypothetical protein
MELTQVASLTPQTTKFSLHDNQIVFIPFHQGSQSEFHVYDCATKTILSYSNLTGMLPHFVYGGGVYAPLNNQIVFIPHNQAPQDQWHLYDCATKSILSYESSGNFGNYAYAGGVFDPTNNQIIFIPHNQAAETQWHTFQKFGSSQISRQLAAHYLFNKF